MNKAMKIIKNYEKSRLNLTILLEKLLKLIENNQIHK
jgi:hypothetical protein